MESSTGKKKHDTEEDILHSKLSEPQLISQILSFLPTRDAVRTSVLSKKWLNNWTSVSKLHFDDSLYSCSPRICTHCKARCYSSFYVSDKVNFLFFLLLSFFHSKFFYILNIILYKLLVNFFFFSKC